MASSNLFGGAANVGTMLTQVDLGHMIMSVGVGISKAQYAMDSSSIDLLERLAAHTVTLSPAGNDGKPTGEASNTRTLLSLGFTPTFYQISEVNLEAKISMSTTSSEEFSTSASMRVGNPISFAAVTVDASYSNKYSFSAEASSTIKARFVALPPPMELRQAIEQMKPRTLAPAPNAETVPGATSPGTASSTTPTSAVNSTLPAPAETANAGTGATSPGTASGTTPTPAATSNTNPWKPTLHGLAKITAQEGATLYKYASGTPTGTIVKCGTEVTVVPVTPTGTVAEGTVVTVEPDVSVNRRTHISYTFEDKPHDGWVATSKLGPVN